MVDRIEKIKQNPWTIEETSTLKRDKQGQSEEEKKREQDSSFEETTDWHRLMAQNAMPQKNLNLHSKDITSVITKEISHSESHGAHEPFTDSTQSQKSKSPSLVTSPAIKVLSKNEIILYSVAALLFAVLVIILIKLII